MSDARLTFIGAGNMARSIIGGLISQGHSAQAITASDTSPTTLAALASDFGIRTAGENRAAAAQADVVVLAVKPQVMGSVCRALRQDLPKSALVVSIAAGISCASLQQWLGEQTAIVRCMPNTPALVQCGASGLFASATVAPEQKHLATDVMSAVGIVRWVDDEALLDAVTAVSGSGPAYFFLLMESMVNAGVEQGLSADVARDLAVQTAAGAAKLAQEGGVDLAELRRRVSSPGGTTEQAIATFERHQFRSIVNDAMTACANRSREMAQEMGE